MARPVLRNIGDVQVVGLKELGDTLDLLGQNVQKKFVREAAKPAAEVFRVELRRIAPIRVELLSYTELKMRGIGKNQRKPGYLRHHIGRWLQVEPDGAFSAFVGPTRSAFYGRFYELGTRHQPARPFMRPTFDAKKDAAARVFGETLGALIDASLPRV